MNIYEMVLGVRSKLGITRNPADTALPINEILAALHEGEMDAISRLKSPVVISYIPLKVGTQAEWRMGQEPYPAGTSDGRVISDGTIYNTRQRWTWDAVTPPVLDGTIRSVCYRESSTSNYGKPLERTSVQKLQDRGWDIDQPITGTPKYWYVRTNDDAYLEGYHSSVIGVWPVPQTVTADAMALRIEYLPRPTASPYLWGTGMDSETLTVNATEGGLGVAFKGTQTAGTVKSVSDLINALTEPTDPLYPLRLPSTGVGIGLEFAVVDGPMLYPRRWYMIDTVLRIMDLAGWAAYVIANPGDSGYGTKFVGFTIQPMYLELDSGAWANDLKFVLCSPTLFGREHPLHSRVIVSYASAKLAREQGDSERASSCEQEYNKNLLLAREGIYADIEES